MSDTMLVGALAALNLVAVVVVDIITGSVPEVLTGTLLALIGGTAGVARSASPTVSGGPL